MRLPKLLSHFITPICSLLFAIFFMTAITFQAKAQQETVTMQPQKPTQGSTVTITYHPDSPNAKIQSPDSLKLIFSLAPHQISQPKKYDMTKTPDGWTATVSLSKQFQAAGFYFKSGDKTDKNINGHQFRLFAYQNGHPVKGVYLLVAETLSLTHPKASQKN